MEYLSAPSIEAAAVAVALIFLSATLPWCWRKSMGERRRTRLPPGTLGLPFIGETLAFTRLSKLNRLTEFYTERERRFGEVFRTSLFGYPTICMPAAPGTKFLFVNEDKLVLQSWPSSVAALLGKHSVSVLTGDEHKRIRGVLMAFLGPDALQRYVSKVCEAAEQHIAAYWEGRSQVVVLPLMKRFTFSVACSLFAGIDDENDQSGLLTPFMAFTTGLFTLPIDLPWTSYHKSKVGRLAINKNLDRCIAERRKKIREEASSPDQDLLSSFLTTPDENGNFLTDDAVKDNIVVLLFAGHETTASTLTIALMLLSKHQDCLQKVLQEQLEIMGGKKDGERLNWDDLKKMKYTWRVLQETMRIQPPTRGAFRKAMVDFEYGGYIIPKGYKLQWSITRSHSNGRLFLNPEEFDPSRFEATPQPYSFVPFGGGARLCPGMEFAKMEMLISMHYLVTSFVWSMLDPLEKVTCSPFPSPIRGLPIVLSPR